LRRRIQSAIDKRFHRRKYDAAKVLAAFYATVRDETDLDALTSKILRVVDETVQPEMFSFGRLQALVASGPEGGEALIHSLLAHLTRFTGSGWDQEDDITMVLLERTASAEDVPGLALQLGDAAQPAPHQFGAERVAAASPADIAPENGAAVLAGTQTERGV
jgi:hypothetical protein